MLRFFVSIAVVACCLTACSTVDVFEKNVALDNHEWSAGNKPVIRFDITDTTARYNLFVVVRHGDDYRYNNLWMNIHTTAPGDSAAQVQALDLSLANNEKGWLGAGMDDIYEHRIRISQSPIPLKKGTYRFQLEQIMRDDPLRAVYNVGLRVEKALN